MLQSVEAGQLAGAYLDVLEEEPVKEGYFLLKNNKIIITPHIAGLTAESQVRISNIIADEVVKVLQGKQSLSLVSL